MGSLFRGACLSDQALQVFHNDCVDPTSKGIMCASTKLNGQNVMAHIATSRDRKTAMGFLRQARLDLPEDHSLVLFEITNFLAGGVHHTDLRMCGTRGQGTEEEIVLDDPYFEKVEAFVFMQTDDELQIPYKL